MKKILTLTLLAALSASSAAVAAPFNGWAMGLGAGYSRANTDLAGKNSTFNQIPLMVHLEYQKSAPQNVFFAFGVGAGYNFRSQKVSLFSGAGSEGEVTWNGNVDLSQKRKFMAEMALKLGYNFGSAVFYGILALRGTQVEHTVTVAGTFSDGVTTLRANGSIQDKSFIWGVAPGVGFDVKVAEKWSLGAEYKYFFEKSPTISKEVKMRNHSAMLRATYHF